MHYVFSGRKYIYLLTQIFAENLLARRSGANLRNRKFIGEFVHLSVMRKIYETDPWLMPFKGAIDARSRRIKDALALYSVDGKLSKGINNHLFYGLHKEEDGYWEPIP